MDDYWQIFLIGGIVLFFLILWIVSILLKKKKQQINNEEFPELLEALGGIQNISEVTTNGSRINLVLQNKKDMNPEMVKQNGVNAIVIQSKKITLVVGHKSKKIHAYLTEKIKQA